MQSHTLVMEWLTALIPAPRDGEGHAGILPVPQTESPITHVQMDEAALLGQWTLHPLSRSSLFPVSTLADT